MCLRNLFKMSSEQSSIKLDEQPICCLCPKRCEDIYGNNPAPLKPLWGKTTKKCCNECNVNKVIPARFAELLAKK